MKSYLQILRESKLKKEEVDVQEGKTPDLTKMDTKKLQTSAKLYKYYEHQPGAKEAAARVEAELNRRLKKEEVELDEGGLPPHLAKLFNDKGDFKDPEKQKIFDAMMKKKTATKSTVTKSKMTDVTPKGYGPNEEVEGLSEGRPSQAHPLEGHDYHKKSNDQLEYIRKDAHTAAEAMKDHNPTAENKYRDQASDASTVLHFRKKNGTPDWYKKKYGHTTKEGHEMANISAIIGKLTEEELSELFNYMMEEVEQIDELSDKTLASYAGKADKQQNPNLNAVRAARDKPGNGADNARAEMDKQTRKAKNRTKGYFQAVSKIHRMKNEEVEELDEISKGLAKAAAWKFADRADDAHDKKDYAGFKKGEAARKLAIAKFTGRAKVNATEEVDLGEEADLTKIHTKTLQSMVQLHKHMGQKNPASKAAADRGQAELDRRMKKEEVEISEKKDMSKGDIAALAGHKGKIDKEDFKALRNKEHLKKEEVELEEGLTPEHLDKLKAEYAKTGDRISTDHANKMRELTKKMPEEDLVKLHKHGIKWLSTSATTQLMLKHGYDAKKLNALKEEVELDEALSDDDFVHINHAGSFHNPAKDKIVGYSKAPKDQNKAPKLKSGANGAMRVGEAKKKGYDIKESVDPMIANIAALISREAKRK